MLRVLAFSVGVLLLSGYLTLKRTIGEDSGHAAAPAAPSIDDVLAS